jgi:uncharacterized protein YqgC (DUF456 family)
MTFDAHALLYLLAALLVLGGLAGVLLPALPGLPLIFAGLLLAAWADGFAHVGGWMLAVLGLLTVFGMLVDYWAGLLGAKKLGAGRWALVGAAIGTLVGLFFGIPGLLLGPFLGAVIGQLVHARDLRHAAKVGVGTWIGLILGMALKFGLALSMLGLFALAWWL